jgi:acyl dehydratase
MDVYFENLPVGHVEESEPLETDRVEMIAYARANDPYPIHTDPDVARQTPFGDVIASFGYTVSLYMRLMHRLDLIHSTQAGSLGAVGWEVTFGGPVRPGDQIRMRHTIVDKRLTSRGDRGLITSRNELINQADEIPVSIDAKWLLAVNPS